MVFWMGSQPWLKVNLNGERFCNESGTYDFILHADASQPGNIHVCLWDARLPDETTLNSAPGHA
ncbi:MAG: hypothetical protein ACLTDR_02380 [Adlercreutzia equolifaciens]